MPQGEVKPPKQKAFIDYGEELDWPFDVWVGRLTIKKSGGDGELPEGKTIMFVSSYDPNDYIDPTDPTKNNCHNFNKKKISGRIYAELAGENPNGCI